mgnify:CR=1 FL=1
MKILVCFLLFLVPIFCSVDTVFASQDGSAVEFDNSKDVVDSDEKKNIFSIKESVLVYDSDILALSLSLKKRQQKKIAKLYKKYLKQQLKVKHKVELFIEDLEDLEGLGIDVDVDYDSFELESTIDKIYKLKADLFFNNYVFLKKVEGVLKKQQAEKYLDIVSFIYKVYI